MSYRGKHRKASAATRHIARVVVGGLAVGAPLAIAATPASASPNWDAIAHCESTGNWSINTGNGYYGGLQFDKRTWQAYGGQGLPHQASKAEQIAVAEKLYAARGASPWPHCGKKGGSSASYKSKNTQGAKKAPAKQKSTKPAQQSAPVVAGVAKSNPNGDYTVAAGDTLSKIAQQLNVQGGWAKLHELNKDFISDANLIVVGQKIATK